MRPFYLNLSTSYRTLWARKITKISRLNRQKQGFMIEEKLTFTCPTPNIREARPEEIQSTHQRIFIYHIANFHTFTAKTTKQDKTKNKQFKTQKKQVTSNKRKNFAQK